jgi:hypothetical protein
MGFRSGTAFLLLALTLTPAAAAADVSDADRATARSLAVEGQEALDQKNFVVALDRFRRADAIIHAPTLLLGVARSQVGMSQWIAAQESYNRILREGAPEGSPEPFFAAIEDARRELEALAPRIPQVLITVQGADAPEVTIDGAPVPSAALGVKRPVDPGTRVVRATAPGLAPAEVRLTVAEGTSQTATLDLKALAAPLGLQVPVAPVVAPPADQGAAGGSGNLKLLGVVSLGVGGAGIALGAVTGLLAVGKHGDLEGKCPGGTCAPALQGDIDSYETLGTVSTIGFIIGGMGAGVGALLLLTAPRSPQRAAVSISPVIGLGYAGARGRF